MTVKRALLWASKWSTILYHVSISLRLPCWENPLRQTETHFFSPKAVSWWCKPQTRPIKERYCYDQSITCETKNSSTYPTSQCATLQYYSVRTTLLSKLDVRWRPHFSIYYIYYRIEVYMLSLHPKTEDVLILIEVCSTSVDIRMPSDFGCVLSI